MINKEPAPRRRGQATIELALVLVLLLIPLLIGIAEIVRAYHEHLAVVHAANVSARWATLTSSQQYCSGYQSVATAVAADLTDVPVQIKAVTTVVVQGTPGPLVEVTVAYSHTLLFGLVDSSMVFTGSAAMPGMASTPVICASCCPTPMGTPVLSATGTNTPLPTHTSTSTDTPVPTNTSTGTSTRTVTNTRTNTSTATNTPTQTYTRTPTNTPTRTNTSTFTYTRTATNTPTVTPTRSNTNTPTPTYTRTFTSTPTNTRTPTNTATPTPTCIPRTVSGESACRNSNGTWQASITVIGLQAGDVVAVRLCTDNSCPGSTGGNMTCVAENCTYSGTGASATNTGVKFILTAGYCSGDLATAPLPLCSTPTRTPTRTFTSTPTHTPTNTPTITLTPTNTPTDTPVADIPPDGGLCAVVGPVSRFDRKAAIGHSVGIALNPRFRAPDLARV